MHASFPGGNHWPGICVPSRRTSSRAGLLCNVFPLVFIFLQQYYCCKLAEKVIRQGPRQPIYTPHYLQAYGLNRAAKPPPHCPFSAHGHVALRPKKGNNRVQKTTCAILASDRLCGSVCPTLVWPFRTTGLHAEQCEFHAEGSARLLRPPQRRAE